MAPSAWQRGVLRLFHLPSGVALALCAALFIAVALADMLTPPELNLALAFVFVVLIATWNLGWARGLAFALAGCLVQYVALLSHASEILYTPVWFAWVANRCIILLLVVALTHPLKVLFDRHAAAARIDSLTGAANHKHFHEALQAEASRSARSGAPFSVAFLDCDDFKLVNDHFGHAVGDKVLRGIVNAASACTRRSDTVARLGGDEFAILLPSAGAAEALVVVRRFREVLESEQRPHPWASTVSIGLASFARGPIHADAVMSICDALMYRAKRSGKGHLEHESIDPATMPGGPQAPYSVMPSGLRK